MNYKVNYQLCQLHEEPLNLICLRASCRNDRIICAICQSERHSESHFIIPLKIHLQKKFQKFRCLTEIDMANIKASLTEQKEKLIKYLEEMLNQIDGRIGEIKKEVQNFFDEKISFMNECQVYGESTQPQIDRLNIIETALKIAGNYEEYFETAWAKLTKITEDIQGCLQNFVISQNSQTLHEWIGPLDISFDQNQLISKSENYKISYFTKPLSLKNSEMSFTIINSVSNWVGIGVCHGDLVKQNSFSFRYHTIGHGVYGISSNGGSWSHYRSEYNNRLCSFQFQENQPIYVSYDSSIARVIFTNENGTKYSLQIDPNENGNLHFCCIFYFQGDIIEPSLQLQPIF